MNKENFILAQCFAWFFLRLSENKDLKIFLDKEGEDLVIHTFLVGHEPPIHRQKKIPQIIKDYSQMADLFAPRKSKTKLKEIFDSEFINALTYGLDLEVLTASKDGLKVKLNDFEITDLDGFLPDKNIWIEITATTKPEKHFFDKLGRLGVCREQEVVLETREFDPETGDYKTKETSVVMKKLKLFHVGLYPVELKFESPMSFRSWSLLDSKNDNKIRAFVVSNEFEKSIWERIQQIRKDLKHFVKN